MVLKKRILASFTFVWTLAAAGMAAVALSATPELNGLDDIQVGERGNQTRIALICAGPCNLEKRGNSEFILRGAAADLSLDLSARSEHVVSLKAASRDGGSLLRIKANRAIDYANTKSCKIGGRAAACIDLFFAAPGPAPSANNASQQSPAPDRAAKPALREGASERLGKFAQLTPPERLAPSSAGVLAKVQPIEKSIEVGKPAIRLREPVTPADAFDYGARVRALLGKDLTPAFCNNAQATLQADPWALGAMVDVGLCTAARGDVSEGEDILSRLLEYTPDNYEAHVGRALIAAQAGEKSVARKYFQDALNALPPIEESNRIVQAMAAL